MHLKLVENASVDPVAPLNEEVAQQPSDTKINSWPGLAGFLQGDGVAELFELVQGAAFGALRAQGGEEVGAGVVVELSGLEHVPDRVEHVVLQRNACSFLAATCCDASVLGG